MKPRTWNILENRVITRISKITFKKLNQRKINWNQLGIYYILYIKQKQKKQKQPKKCKINASSNDLL